MRVSQIVHAANRGDTSGMVMQAWKKVKKNGQPAWLIPTGLGLKAVWKEPNIKVHTHYLMIETSGEIFEIDRDLQTGKITKKRINKIVDT